MNEFEADFGCAYKELWENWVNVQGAGFAPHNTNSMRKFQAEMIKAVTQLANAEVTDRSTIIELIETNACIITRVGVVNTQLAETLNELRTLQRLTERGVIEGRFDRGS